MGEIKVWNHNVSLTFYQLTSRSFHVNLPSHSWDTAFSQFDLENPRSRSCMTGKLKVTTWVEHSIDQHPFDSMSIGHPIPEIRLFQNLTLQIQGQGHGWGQSWKSQSGCSILSIHIPLIPCQSAIPFLRFSIFKIWLWKSKVKVIEVNIESHNMAHQHYIDSHPFRSMSIGHSIHKIRLFQKLILTIQGQGHGWGQGWKSQHESNIPSTHIPLIPYQSPIPFLKYLSKSDLENPRSKSWLSSKLKVTKWVQHPIDWHPFRSMSIGLSIPEIQHFQNLTLKIQGQGQMTIMLHNYRSRQFHRTSNDINPSSGFRDMFFAKSGPSAAWFDKFLANGQAHVG